MAFIHICWIRPRRLHRAAVAAIELEAGMRSESGLDSSSARVRRSVVTLSGQGGCDATSLKRSLLGYGSNLFCFVAMMSWAMR